MPDIAGRTSTVVVRADRVSLIGELTIPPEPAGVVVLADTSVPGALATGQREAAAAFIHAGFAVLQLDLLTRAEGLATRRARMPPDVGTLGARLEAALLPLAEHPVLRALPVGLFAADTGAAAALVVAARAPAVQAVVSRCGRPELAYGVLRQILCPTLWIVGGADAELLDLHHQALRRIGANARLHVVPGVGRLLDEPGALDDALRLAAGWFREHLARPMQRSRSWTGFTIDAKQGSSSRVR